MVRLLLAFVVAVFAIPAYAAQIQADAPPGATQCGFYLDGATTPTVVSVISGKCTMPLSTSLAIGPHQVVGDSRETVPVWGTLPPGPKSAPPYDFTKPGASTLPPPTNWKVIP